LSQAFFVSLKIPEVYNYPLYPEAFNKALLHKEFIDWQINERPHNNSASKPGLSRHNYTPLNSERPHYYPLDPS
jgi:hypothetical protein